MSKQSLGYYRNLVTGRAYEVLKTTRKRAQNSQESLRVAHDYWTSCGINLEPLDPNLEIFELTERDCMIQKVP